MDTLFPHLIIAYIGHFTPFFPANNFIYFRAMMLSYMLLGQSRKCMTNISKVSFFVDRHLSSWERFLSQHQWDINGVRQRLVTLLMEQLGQKLLICGGYLAWVDTTFAAKVKGKMPGVQKWHDHNGNPEHGDYIVGHHWSIVGLFGATFLMGQWTSLCFPLLSSLISGQTSGLGFVVNPEGVAKAMEFWDAVCPLIAQLFQMTGNKPMRVVCDAYFSKSPFINWMLSLPVHVITRMRKDAVGWDDPLQENPSVDGKRKRGRKPKKGKEWKIASLIKTFPTNPVTVLLYGKIKTLDVVSRCLWIRGVTLQKVVVVVIKTQGAPILLLSTDLTLTAKEIIEIYGMRFSLEISIRDAKQHFGFTQYQCTSYLAIIRFAALGLCSLCLWKLTALKEIDSAWLGEKEGYSPLSFNRISRGLRRLVIQTIFRNSACGVDFKEFNATPEEILQKVA